MWVVEIHHLVVHLIFFSEAASKLHTWWDNCSVRLPWSQMLSVLVCTAHSRAAEHRRSSPSQPLAGSGSPVPLTGRSSLAAGTPPASLVSHGGNTCKWGYTKAPEVSTSVWSSHLRWASKHNLGLLIKSTSRAQASAPLLRLDFL